MAMMEQQAKDNLASADSVRRGALTRGEKFLQAVKDGWMTGDGLVKVDHFLFKDKTIYLDGYEFATCRFDGCKLQYKSDRFRMKKCFLGDGTEMSAVGDAALSAAVSSRGDKSGLHFGHFDFARQADGTTIVNVW